MSLKWVCGGGKKEISHCVFYGKATPNPPFPTRLLRVFKDSQENDGTVSQGDIITQM